MLQPGQGAAKIDCGCLQGTVDQQAVEAGLPRVAVQNCAGRPGSTELIALRSSASVCIN